MGGYVINHRLYKPTKNEEGETVYIGEDGILGEHSTYISWVDVIKFLEKQGYEINKKSK